MMRILMGLVLIFAVGLAIRHAPALVATIPARTMAVSKRETRITFTANGSIETPVQAKLSPVISGEIVSLTVKEGDRVKAGAVIATLDSATIDAEIEAVKAGLAVAQANLDRIQAGSRPQEISEGKALVNRAGAALEERRQDLDRTRALHASKAASLKELDAAQAAFNMAKEEVSGAQQKLALLEEGARSQDIDVVRRKLDEARAQIKSLQTRKDKTVIRAPIDGTVVTKHAHQGEVAMPGQPLIHLVNLDRVEATLNVEETYVDGIRKGMTGEVLVDAIPDRPYTGPVTYISPVSSEQLKVSLLKEEEDVKRFHVKIELDGRDGRLRSGMTVKGRFTLTRSGVFVPREAVLQRAGRTMVKVRVGAAVQDRRVRTGLADGDLIQILEGLSSGETLELPPAGSGASATGFISTP